MATTPLIDPLKATTAELARQRGAIAAGKAAGVLPAPGTSAAQELQDAINLNQAADALASDVEVVSAAPAGDGQMRVVCFWPTAADKTAGEFAPAWRIVDGSTFSATTMIPGFVRESSQAMADVNLSALGKRAAAVEVARRYAKRLPDLGTKWATLRTKLEDKNQGLADLPTYSKERPWEWVQDLEAARVVRELDTIPRSNLARGLAMGREPGVSEALLRVPAHLTGLRGDQLEAIRGALIELKNPGFGAYARTRHRVLAAAAQAIRAVHLVLKKSGLLDSKEMRLTVGAEVAEALAFAAAQEERPMVEPLPLDTQDQADAKGAAYGAAWFEKGAA
jgi:hypothetical protein